MFNDNFAKEKEEQHMSQNEDELVQIFSWLSEQGLGPGATADEQLCVLWRALQHCQGNVTRLNKTLEIQRSQYAAEIVEVHKSLEQIRVFTGHKDVLAQEIQDENDQLRDRLQRLVSQQDAQVSEVAKMLYDQGLTELIHSGPSEQMAYLLVERASLLDTSEGRNVHSNPLGTGLQDRAVSMEQTPHKRALCQSQSPWKKLLGLHKNQGKSPLIPSEPTHCLEHAVSVQKACHRLERDLEEGSKRLAMAHNEIRRLTSELESAHKIQRAYEPELEAAKHEVEQLRQEVERVKKYEMVGLRKAKELNNSLNNEVQYLRSKLEAETTSRQQEAQKQFHTARVQTDPLAEPEKILILQTELEKLQSTLARERSRADSATELNKSLKAEVIQANEVCIKLQDKIETQMKHLSGQQSEIEELRWQLEICEKGNDHKKEICADIPLTDNHLLQSSEEHPHLIQSENCDSFSNKDECEFLKKELCETLKCLYQERRKYHEMKGRLKLKLFQAKLRLEYETKWRDEKIEDSEQELFLCSYALTKEKELMTTVTMENDKLLVERKRLLQQQLNEELYNKKNRHTVFQSRIEDLEMENRKLHNKILDLSTQVLSMEGSLQNIHSLRAAQVLKDCDPRKILAQPAVHTARSLHPDVASQSCSSWDGAETWSQCSSLARSGEMGYLNLNSHNLRLYNTTDP